MDETQEPDVLEAGDCWRLLSSVAIGRLAVAVSDEEGPDVFPVNFRTADGLIVFRTGAGAKLRAITARPWVTFQADGYDAGTRVAWSVMAKGRAAETALTDDPADAADRLLVSWSPGPKEHLARIDVATITGRRFRAETGRASGLSLDDAIRAGLE